MDTIEVNIHTLVRNEGSIALFGATRTDNGNEVIIAADHRPAHYLAMALEGGDHVVSEVEPWQIVGRA